MKRPIIAIALCFLLAQTAAPAAAKEPLQDDVDRFVQAEMARLKLPGLALAVMRHGKIVKVAGYGLANVEHGVPVKPETIFQSGSVGKQFTATAVMMLVEEGKLALDSPVRAYLPGAPPAWKNVTVRHLLTHTSGIKNYDEKDLDFRKDYTEDQLLDIAARLPLDFQPGERWNYSNTGYVVLGILIGKVTGKFWGDFLRERIFEPLGMTTARVISETDIVPNRAAGYRLVKGVLKNQEWVSPSLNTTADGSLYLTVLDYAKWDAALYTEQLLKRESLESMWTQAKLADGRPRDYGFGWALYSVRGHRLVEHAGGWQGFSTDIARFVDDGLTVVVLVNMEMLSSPARIARGIAGLFNREVAPRAYEPIEDTEPEVTRFARGTVVKILKGEADPAAFTPEVAAALFPVAIKMAAEKFATVGELRSFRLVERKEEAGFRLYTYEAEFEGQVVHLVMRLTGQGKIAGLFVAPD
jgi:CubicO group peptidase (beta-lactamase class C family)